MDITSIRLIAAIARMVEGQDTDDMLIVIERSKFFTLT